MSNLGIVSFDLDGTLCDTSIRRNALPKMSHEESLEYDWVSYSKLCLSDSLVDTVAFSLRTAQRAGYDIAIVSARALEAREETIKWLSANNINYDYLYLGNRKRTESHDQYKVRRILELQTDTKQFVRLHYDDWPTVKPALATINVPVLLVTPPYDHNGSCA